MPTPSDTGEAGELLVAGDLLARGLEVTKPYNRNGPDDLHVRLSVGWKNVQVKVGRLNKDGTVSLTGIRRGGAPISSHILALVDLGSKQIRYISNRRRRLPKELR